MFKGRKVGTLTSGIVLLVFGVIFLLKLFINIDILLIASLWPVILILLGIEIIAAYVLNNDQKLQYDFGAIVLVIILAFFAMAMGGAEFVVTHLPEFRTTL